MSRSATRTGPGTSRSPSAQRLTVRASTSKASAAATCESPSAARAARNSAADNGTTGQQRHASRLQRRGNVRFTFPDGEGARQRAIGVEQRKPLWPIGSAGQEPNGAGGKRRNGDGAGVVGALAHALCAGPLALSVNEESA